MNPILKQMQEDMDLKDQTLYPIYDTVKEQLCKYFIKFFNGQFSVCFIDKTEEYRSAFAYEVLQKIMTGWYIPVNARLLVLGRRRTNYYAATVENYMATRHLSYSKEFPLGDDICIIHRNGKFFRNGEEDNAFFFRNLLEL